MNTPTRPRLAAAPRAVTGKKVASLRRQGILPAVVYGHGHASQSIQLDAHEFEVLRRHTSRNTILDLTVGSDKTQPVLLQHIHEHILDRRPIHVDFYVVNVTEEIALDVPIALVGESEAVVRGGGTLLHLRDSIHVRSLPDALPSVIEVDVTSLRDFEATIRVSDLTLPAGVTVVTDGGELVARVQPPRVEVEAPTAAPEAAEVAPEAGEAEQEG